MKKSQNPHPKALNNPKHNPNPNSYTITPTATIFALQNFQKYQIYNPNPYPNYIRFQVRVLVAVLATADFPKFASTYKYMGTCMYSYIYELELELCCILGLGLVAHCILFVLLSLSLLVLC